MRKTSGNIDFLIAMRMEMAALDLTQRDLARRAGFSDWQMSKLLNGKADLTPSLRAQLVLALHADTLASANYIVTTPNTTHGALTV